MANAAMTTRRMGILLSETMTGALSSLAHACPARESDRSGG
jgi:hypothetical protein